MPPGVAEEAVSGSHGILVAVQHETVISVCQQGLGLDISNG